MRAALSDHARGAADTPGAGHRPPWSTQGSILSHCTSCGDCIAACPEGILTTGRAGAPVVQLNGGACIFCGACADACKEPVFAATDNVPWTLVARIDARCLLHQNVACQSCTDACDVSAMQFSYTSGPVGAVSITDAACTGCGACLGVCPTQAITLADISSGPAA